MHVSFFINHKGFNWKALQNMGPYWGYKRKIISRVFSFQVSFALPLGDRPTDGTKILKMRATYLWSAVTGSDYFILCVVADEKSLTKDLTPVSCSFRTLHILYIVQSLLSGMFLLQISNKYSWCLWHSSTGICVVYFQVFDVVNAPACHKPHAVLSVLNAQRLPNGASLGHK